MGEKISVIMGVFNAERTLKRAIDSIINQTYTNWEFIICDDASTDSCYQILSDYAQKDQRILLLQNQINTGLAASLNRCIEVAQGDYIARMDADDYSMSSRFEKQLALLKEHLDAAMTSCSAYLFDEQGIWGCRSLSDSKTMVKDCVKGNPNIHPATIFKKESLWLVNGYRVTKRTLRLEDYDLFMRMMAKNLFSINTSEKLYCFEENRDSLKRRKYRFRIDEFFIRIRGYSLMGVKGLDWLYIFKPLIVGLMPLFFTRLCRKKHFSIKNKPHKLQFDTEHQLFLESI